MWKNRIITFSFVAVIFFEGGFKSDWSESKLSNKLSASKTGHRRCPEFLRFDIKAPYQRKQERLSDNVKKVKI